MINLEFMLQASKILMMKTISLHLWVVMQLKNYYLILDVVQTIKDLQEIVSDPKTSNQKREDF